MIYSKATHQKLAKADMDINSIQYQLASFLMRRNDLTKTPTILNLMAAWIGL